MIPIESTSLVLLYLFLFLFLCFGFWLFSHFKQRTKTLPPLFTMKRCEYCTFDYLHKTGDKISKCPQCQSFNKTD